MGAEITAIVMLIVVALGAIADAVIAARVGSEATISAVIMRIGMKYPVLPLAIGFVMGHFFWPQTIGGAANHGDLPPVIERIVNDKKPP